MKRKHINNFKKWMDEMKRKGKIKSKYPSFNKSPALAELIGVVLGDGNIQQFPRTERLIIAANSNNAGFVERYSGLVKAIFGKNPCCMKSKRAQCIRISIYEKFISKRLGVPPGNRKLSKVGIPAWAWKRKQLLTGCLRGLYEAEGSFSVHLPTSTYKASFSNKNPKLLEDVYKSLQILGFHPLYERYRIMVSRKDEFFRLKSLLSFREY